MPNDFYTRAYNPLPEQRVSSQVLKDEFARVEAGFDEVQSDADRAIKLPEGTADQTLALDAVARANLLLAFNASGNITAIAAANLPDGSINDATVSPLNVWSSSKVNAELARPQGILRSARTSNTVLAAADQGKLIDITSGTFTQTFDAVATLGDGWWCYLRNSGTGDITLDPSGAELIDGVASLVMYPGAVRLVQCDGLTLRTVASTQTYELISTTNASAAATVEWTNFETLASNYSCLRLVASGLIGSAASADLNGQIKISGTFQAATAWQSASAGAAFGGVSLSSSNQLKNTASKAMALDLNVYALGITQQPAVAFTSLGGHDYVVGYTYPLVGGSYFDVDVAPTTPIQGLRISASTGTISGVFRLYGVRK